MTDERGTITDAKELRALAHPVRWRLLQLFGEEDTATATRCAELTGESVASCSYHLNILAKYGYLEQAEGGQGREKPWRATTKTELNFSDSDIDDVERSLAVEAASDVFIDEEAARLKRIIRRPKTAEAPEWREVNLITSGGSYLTPDEAKELQAQIYEMVDRYAARRRDPESRPAGSRLVRLFVAMTTGDNPNRKG